MTDEFHGTGDIYACDSAASIESIGTNLFDWKTVDLAGNDDRPCGIWITRLDNLVEPIWITFARCPCTGERPVLQNTIGLVPRRLRFGHQPAQGRAQARHQGQGGQKAQHTFPHIPLSSSRFYYLSPQYSRYRRSFSSSSSRMPCSMRSIIWASYIRSAKLFSFLLSSARGS